VKEAGKSEEEKEGKHHRAPREAERTQYGHPQGVRRSLPERLALLIKGSWHVNSGKRQAAERGRRNLNGAREVGSTQHDSFSGSGIEGGEANIGEGWGGILKKPTDLRNAQRGSA